MADALPGLIDTAILRSTPNRSGDRAKPTEDEFYATAPKKGMFRLTPATAVAETVWDAYGSDKLHWYVPAEIAWIDRIKGIAPGFMRKQIAKNIAGLFGANDKQASRR